MFKTELVGYKRLAISDKIFIREGDIIQYQLSNGNLNHVKLNSVHCGYWHLIGMSTMVWRVGDCHKSVWRLKLKN